MGRYYSGDIEGKFWFAVQSSNAADRFGVQGECFILDYCYNEEDLSNVQAELKALEESISVDVIEKFNEFFKRDFYNDKALDEAGLGFLWAANARDYADYILGKKIEQCIMERGQCYFQADMQ